MEPLLFLGEVALFAAALCGLHALKPRLGLAPLYLALGLFQTFLFVADKGDTPITVALFGTDPAFIGYSLFLPLLLAGMVLVYVLEGTHAARALLVAVVAVHVLGGAIDTLLAWHAGHPPPGRPDLSDSVLVEHSLVVRACSLGAFLVDFVVILVAYQFLLSRLPALPQVVPLFTALLAAMTADALVFGALYGLSTSWSGLQLPEKLQTAAAAALPVSTYLGWQLRRQSADVRRGVIERGVFDVIDLRRKVDEYRARLKEAQARFVYVKDTFSRYVSPEVVDSILEDPSRVRLGGELRQVTVLFVDIAGYSTLSESLAPTEIIELLNRYFERVSRVIFLEKGLINEFEGDAVLAVFGAPLDLDDQAERGVRAALGILDEVERLNAEWRADGTLDRWHCVGLDRLSVRVGVHTGPAVAGNIGSRSRIKYAVIGDTVNTASRVEGLNKALGTSILLTAATADALGPARDRYALVDLGPQVVKGRAEAVHVFTVAAAASTSTPDVALA